MLQSSKDYEIAHKIYIAGRGHKYHVQLIQDIDPNDPSKIQLCIIYDSKTYGTATKTECLHVNGAMNFKNVELRMFSEFKSISELSDFKAEVLM